MKEHSRLFAASRNPTKEAHFIRALLLIDSIPRQHLKSSMSLCSSTTITIIQQGSYLLSSLFLPVARKVGPHERIRYIYPAMSSRTDARLSFLGSCLQNPPNHPSCAIKTTTGRCANAVARSTLPFDTEGCRHADGTDAAAAVRASRPSITRPWVGRAIYVSWTMR